MTKPSELPSGGFSDSRYWQYDSDMACIRIIDVPPGAAPDWVREEWVGLVPPLPEGPLGRRRRWAGLSLLPAPKGCLSSLLATSLYAYLTGKVMKINGYGVEALRAVEILSMDSPEAAAWWHENTPDLMRPGRMLVFHAEVCEEEP
jgi:hypothetical protein